MLILPVMVGFILAFLLTGLIVLVMILPTRYVRRTPSSPRDVSVQVLVLGDIGRSPRMQYHALSIAKHGGRVSLIGYQETTPHPGILINPRIKIYPLSPPPAIIKSKTLPFVVSGPLKVIWQIYTLIHTLGFETSPSPWLLVQNPPSIPTLLISLIITLLRNTHLLIDWHNYGWTILSTTRGPTHPFVRISRLYEALLARWAPTANLTVTRAMARQLSRPPYSIDVNKSPILTLHDRPASIFKPISSQEARRSFLETLPITAEHAQSIMEGTTKLIVSSTSWTPDEDFSILLDALIRYCNPPVPPTSLHPVYPSPLPKILAIITGKGPQKSHYESLIASLHASGKLRSDAVTIKTAFLSLENYSTLLSCADLGICLHMSSSGVDLPMKVVDMFGAGLPVAAYSDYESFDELVKEGVNGMGFKTPAELTKVLWELLVWGKESEEKLKGLREGAVREGMVRWDDEWDGVVGQLLGLVLREGGAAVSHGERIRRR